MRVEPTVYIVDDDPGICDVVSRLSSVLGMSSQAYGSGGEFLEAYSEDLTGCLVLDIWLPDMTGLELYSELLDRNFSLPVIIISGHADIPLTVRAIKNGALDFLEKPFQNSVLLEAIRGAVELNKAKSRELRSLEELSERFRTLTEREREIVDLLVAGLQNKEIARELNISRRTVETHRAHVMSKLKAQSLSQLVQSALRMREIAR